MGERGPGKKPQVIVERTGNPGKRPIEPDPVEFPVSNIDRPPALKGIAADWWDVNYPILVAGRLMTDAYTEMLVQCAIAASQVYSVQDQMNAMRERTKDQRLPDLIMGTNGRWCVNPFLPELRKAQEHYRKLLREFGLSPSSVRDVSQVPEKPNGGKLQDLLNPADE